MRESPMIPFSPSIDEYGSATMRPTLLATNRDIDYEYALRLTIAPHLCNHITPAGTIVHWGRVKIVLQRADEI